MAPGGGRGCPWGCRAGGRPGPCLSGPGALCLLSYGSETGGWGDGGVLQVSEQLLWWQRATTKPWPLGLPGSHRIFLFCRHRSGGQPKGKRQFLLIGKSLSKLKTNQKNPHLRENLEHQKAEIKVIQMLTLWRLCEERDDWQRVTG